MNEQIDGKLSSKTKISFVTAGFGQNCLISFINTFLLAYLTEGVGLSVAGIAAVTSIMTVARIWDAVNDPIMGVLIDKTHTRWGKLRPFILFTALPIAILTIMMFTIPNMAEIKQVVYFGVVYILWEMIYTVSDVPYWGLAGSLTHNIDERTKLISAARTVGTAALGLVTLLTPMIINAFRGDGEASVGWSRTAILIAVMGMGLFTLAFFGTKERVNFKSDMTVKQTFKNMVKNKPLFLTILTSMLGFGKSVIQVGGVVMAIVVFGDEGKFMIMGASIIVAMIIATLLTPLLLKKISKKSLMQWTNGLSIVVYTVMFLLGYQNFAIVVGMIFLTGLASGVFLVLQTAMVADSVDYLEFFTGERNEGICFAGLTFSSKFMGALATFTFGITLAAVGYTTGINITDSMKTGLYFGVTIIPAISSALALIPMFFYDVTEKNIAEMVASNRAKQNSQAK